jgi:hypothetical protein
MEAGQLAKPKEHNLSMFENQKNDHGGFGRINGVKVVSTECKKCSQKKPLEAKTNNLIFLNTISDH